MSHEAEVLVSVEGGVGRLTLNRPRALNALNYEMILLLTETLTAWVEDAAVSVVVLDGAGERGLCAGGDVRVLYDNAVAAREARDGGAQSDPNAGSRQFFFDEYRLTSLIAGYPKPFVALMDGITMGGGIGVSGHARIRVVTERSRLAMPETRIGFCPDVGGTWLLARAPGELGTYLGLNSATMTPSDAIAAGFADYLVPSELLPQLLQGLADGSPIEVVQGLAVTPQPSALAGEREWIDACYSADTVEEIAERLGEYAVAHPGTAAADSVARALAGLGELSPTALTVTLAGLRVARGLPGLREALALEYRMASWLIEQPDMAEGIRAQVIDKDRQPRWNPAELADVAPDAAATAVNYPVELWP